MNDMNVSMKLTMSDLASPQLKQFSAVIDSLSVKISALNEKFTALSSQNSILKQSVVSSTRVVSDLTASTTGLESSLGLVVTRLNAAIDRMAAFSETALTARTSASTLGGELNTANVALDGMAVRADKAAGSMRGLVEAWGALKIAKGLDIATKSQADIQTQEAQLRVAGISPQAAKYAAAQSYNMSAAIGLVGQNEVLDARRKLIAALGQNKEMQIDKALPELIRNAVVVKALYQKNSSIGDIAGSFAAGAELLGRANTAQGIVSASDVLLRAQGGSQGRMTQADMETVLRQNKYNPLLNDKSVTWLMAFAEQLKNLGGGGGGGGRGVSMAGTGFSMLSKTIMNPKMSKQTAAMYQRFGMFSDQGMKDLATSTTGTVAGNQLLDAGGAIRDLPGWIERVLAPHVIAYVKKHPKEYGLSAKPTAEELNGAITKAMIQAYGSTGGVNVASLAIAASSPEKAAMIRSHQAMMEQTKVGQQAIDQLAPMTTAWMRVTSAANRFANMIGAVLYPAVTKVFNIFADIINKIDDFVSKTPAAAEGITAIAVAVSGMLALRAAAWFVRVIGLITSLGAASTATATTVAASSAAMATAWKARLLEMGTLALRFVSIIGIAFLLKEAADNIKIGGVAISGHIAALIFGLFSQFDRFFAWLAGKFASAWDWGTNLSNKITGKTGFWANAARAMGVNNYVTPDGKGVSNDQANPFRKTQQSFKSAEADWNAAGLDALTPHGGNGSAYQPKDGQDALANFEHAMNQRVSQAVLGPNVPISSMGVRGRSHRSSRTPANTAYQHALDFLRNMQASGDPIQQIKNKFAPNIAAMSNGGRVDLAAQLEGIQNQQIDKETKKLQQQKLEALKKTLSDLQSELGDKSKVTAALVQTGALTPDQGQRQTLKDQKAAAPDLLKAAESVRAYEQAIGQSTTAIDAAIIKYKALGDGLTALQKNIQDTVQGAFQSFFSEIMGGKTSWKDMGKKFVQNLMNGINSSVSKELSSQLVSAIFGQNTGMGKGLRSVGGSGQLMSGIGSWIGNLFGGGTTQQQSMLNAQWPGSGGSSASSGWMSALGSIASAFISSFAVGADNIPNDMVAQIHKGEMIIPAAGAEAIRSGKLGGSNVNLGGIHITAMDSQSVLGAMGGIQRELATMLAGTNANLNLGV